MSSQCYNYQKCSKQKVFFSVDKQEFLFKYPFLQKRFVFHPQYLPSTDLNQCITNPNQIAFETISQLIKEQNISSLKSTLIFQESSLSNNYQALIYQGQTNQKFIKSGRGLALFQNGEVYQGEWMNNEFNGKGLYKYSQNSYYEGEFIHSKKSGKGKLVLISSLNFQYEGEFFEDQMKGKGKIKYIQSGQVYDGDFLNNLPHGYGVYLTQEMKYTGYWKYGVMWGQGKCEWFSPSNQNISCYTGQYYKGKKHGFGQYNIKDEKILRGKWEHGKFKRGSSSIIVL